MADVFDLLIIGTGPGGYVCAIRAAQLGLKVAVAEKRATHGGTCLNVGCIPSKAMLHASELFHEAAHSFARMGIQVAPTLDLKQMQAFKQEAIDGNTKGIDFLLKKNKVTVIRGTARIVKAGEVEVTGPDDVQQTVNAKNIIIATGSQVASLRGIEIDEKTVVSSTGALEIDQVPGHLVVVGAGVIGLELGSVWARLGSKVTVIEYLDRILPGMDGEVAKNFQRILTKQGFTFQLGAKVTGIETSQTGAKVSVEPAAGGAGQVIDADKVLVAVGRVAYTDGLGLTEAGVALDARGRVVVNAHYATNVPGIYAIGDVIAGPMLAHKAEDEGIALAEQLAGQAGHVNYDTIPGVVYTWPEVAAVGFTEEQLKEQGKKYKVGSFPFKALGRARAGGDLDGFIKILADAKTDEVLGVHMIGARCADLIAEAVTAMEFRASAEDISRMSHAHPTFAEAIKEAALAATGNRALHV